MGNQPIIASVPVGPALAVAVRSGALAAGCVSFTASKPDSTEEVPVPVLDRPMLLDGVDLRAVRRAPRWEPARAKKRAEGIDIPRAS